MDNQVMTNEGLKEVLESIEVRRAPIKAATKRIQLILDTNPHLVDDTRHVVCTNDILDDAQQFLRNNLDLNGTGLNNLTDEYEYLGSTIPGPILAAQILDDLRVIWDDEFSRDTISRWAMEMSLCPMHFCDWAACFDDDDDECRAIRAIFPHSHDT